MRLAAFLHDGRRGLAAETQAGWRGLQEGDAAYPGELSALLDHGANFARVAETLAAGHDIDINSVRFRPPLERPGKILCVGLNYRDHAHETGMVTAAAPTIFARFPSSLIGHGQPILRPRQSVELDFEGELVAIIGKAGRHIPRNQALRHVAGYSIFNDATLRDVQFWTTQWTLGKNFDATGGFGPFFVPAAELPPGCEGLRLVTRLSGRVVQDAVISDMIFPVGELVARISAIMTLLPGDIILTGTPAGVGMSRSPKLWMQPGDICEVDIGPVGILSNPIADEAPNRE